MIFGRKHPTSSRSSSPSAEPKLAESDIVSGFDTYKLHESRQILASTSSHLKWRNWNCSEDFIKLCWWENLAQCPVHVFNTWQFSNQYPIPVLVIIPLLQVARAWAIILINSYCLLGLYYVPNTVLSVVCVLPTCFQNSPRWFVLLLIPF